MRHRPVTIRRISRRGSIVQAALALAVLAATFGHSRAVAGEIERNVAMYVSAREILFFSAPAGVWTSVRLDAGERILQRGADGNVAAVVTNQRAIGFSAALAISHTVSVTDDENIESFKVEGNVATLLTRLRALGFSAATGKWADIQRFYPGR